jgi:hypothetical protein
MLPGLSTPLLATRTARGIVAAKHGIDTSGPPASPNPRTMPSTPYPIHLPAPFFLEDRRNLPPELLPRRTGGRKPRMASRTAQPGDRIVPVAAQHKQRQSTPWRGAH